MEKTVVTERETRIEARPRAPEPPARERRGGTSQAPTGLGGKWGMLRDREMHRSGLPLRPLPAVRFQASVRSQSPILALRRLPDNARSPDNARLLASFCLMAGTG